MSLHCSTRTLRLEIRLQELSTRIQRFQESHLSESQYTRNVQAEAIERLLAQIHSLKEPQGRTHGAFNVLRNGPTTIKELTYQDLGTQAIPHSITQRDRRLSKKDSVIRKKDSAIIGLKVEQLAISDCRQNCSCQCHMRKQWRSHQLFNKVLGNLFIGYSRTPHIALNCDLASCGRHQRSIITVIYVFPQWLLNQVLSVMLFYSRRSGIVANLKILRPRSETDIVWMYVTTGDVDRIKASFDRGEASPFDIGGSSDCNFLAVRTFALPYMDDVNNRFAVCRQCGTTRDVQVSVGFRSRPRHECRTRTVMF